MAGKRRTWIWTVALPAIALVAMAGLAWWYVGRGVTPLLEPTIPLRPASPGGGGGTAGRGSPAGGVLPLNTAGGLKVRFFAQGLAGARVILFDPAGDMLVSQPSLGRVTCLIDANRDGVSDDRRVVLEGLDSPHGLAFRPGASPTELYVAETSQVRRYRYDPRAKRATDPRDVLGLPAGGGHFTRTIVFGPDGKLYVTAGSSSNVAPESDPRRASMMVAAADGSGSRIFARGLRNTVFFIFDARGGVWGNDMGRDLLGDDLPPDELNIIVDGGDYGWPYCYGARVPDPSTGGTAARCAGTVAPVFGYQAHSAPLGLAFVTRDTSMPATWVGDLIVAFHGSWNRTVPTGYKLVRLEMDGDKVVAQHDLVTGWLTAGRVSGRPVDVVFGPDGALYVSDDRAGAIYRITQR